MDEQPKIPLPYTERERLRRVEEVCQHAVYLLQEREAGGLDRVAGESSFVVHFYHRRLRRDILAVRRHLWGAKEPPMAVRSAEDLLKLRRKARVWKNYPALGIDRPKANRVLTSRVGKRWTDLLLGDVALLLAARSGLPAGLSGTWHSANLNKEAGTRLLYEGLSPEEREAYLLDAVQQGSPWESQITAQVILRVFTNTALRDVLAAYGAARESLLEISDVGEEVLADGSGLAFDVKEDFDDRLSCLELTVSTTQGLPAEIVLRPWVQACLSRHRSSLRSGGSYLSDDMIRLWATSALVDFAGLSNREAMRAWDQVNATLGMPLWDISPKSTTQTPETSFTNSRREVFRPRKDFYLRLLETPPGRS